MSAEATIETPAAIVESTVSVTEPVKQEGADLMEVDEKLESQIIKQVEFYFSNSNLPKDTYLKNLYDSDTDNWVSLAIINSFSRMKTLIANLSITQIAEILRKSNKLRVSADNNNITRSEPLPEHVNTTKSTIYAKGFPEESTIDSISEFFSKHGTVQSVRMRRDAQKKFKGSAFVEFASPEEAQMVVAQELKLNDQPLILLTKSAYLNKKKAEEEAKNPDAKKKVTGNKRKADSDNTNNNADNEETPKEFKKDLLVRFTNVGSTSTRESLKGLVEKVGGSAQYVDYSKGEQTGVVRLADDSTVNATAVVAKIEEEKLELDGAKAEVSAVTGEEEEKYWKTVWEAQAARKKNKGGNSGRGRGGKGGRGGRGRGRGRK